jgi:septal ring factor EnvC (AmiA/AmiB activator)
MASIENPELSLFLLTFTFRCSILVLLGAVVESPQEAGLSFPFSHKSLVCNMVANVAAAGKKRSSEMMKQVVIVTCLIALVFPLALAGCCRVEMADLQEELKQTRTERDDLKVKLETDMKTRGQSQGQVMEFTGSLSEFQKQIDAFVSFREDLQKREDELARLRQVALAEAQIAQERMGKLGTQLQAETERVIQLQGQLKEAQSAIVDLQDKLKE